MKTWPIDPIGLMSIQLQVSGKLTQGQLACGSQACTETLLLHPSMTALSVVGMKTERLVVRTFFSVLSCRARLSTFDHAHMRGSSEVWFLLMRCLVTHPKSFHLIACFTKHFSAFLTPSHQSVLHRHRLHPLHDR